MPGKKHLRGLGQKEQRMYEHIVESSKESGRYGKRAKEVAARTVLKHHKGACGACTVLVDGERTLSCLALAVQYEDTEITTIEGLAENGTLHPMQAAFVEHDGFQCGYCTPGQICSAVGMVQEFRRGSASAVTNDVSASVAELSDEEIKERMSGNLCRCGAYVGIREAIREAAEVAR